MAMKAALEFIIVDSIVLISFVVILCFEFALKSLNLVAILSYLYFEIASFLMRFVVDNL